MKGKKPWEGPFEEPAVQRGHITSFKHKTIKKSHEGAKEGRANK